MNVPEFTAELSLQKSSGHYTMASQNSIGREKVVEPQQYYCGPCDGRRRTCVEPGNRYCFRDPGCLFGDLCPITCYGGDSVWSEPCSGTNGSSTLPPRSRFPE